MTLTGLGQRRVTKNLELCRTSSADETRPGHTGAQIVLDDIDNTEWLLGLSLKSQF